jgi:enoyl-CoA hydratase
LRTGRGRDKEIHIGFSERWRDIPKPTVAAVEGKAISSGLMPVCPCVFE